MSIKNTVLTAVVSLIIFSILGYKIFDEQIAKIIMKRIVHSNAGVDRAATMPDGLHVFICGAGSPMPDPKRAGPCTGIVAGQNVFVFDTGSGSVKNLTRMNFPLARIDAGFITHLHSDHIDGLGELLLQAWVGGSRKAPLPIYGPHGITRVVDSFNEAYFIDSTYRYEHHGADVADPKGFGGNPVEFNATQTAKTVYQTENLTIQAINVSHHPIDPSLAYRIDYKDRSVTISGDTTYNQDLITLAQDSDLLLHEALNIEMVEILREAFQEKGLKNIDKIMFDIQDYHSTPIDAARVAKNAGASALVLNHIVPPLPNSLLNPLFLKGTSAEYNGEITIAEDGMIFSLPAGSKNIEHIDGIGF